MLSRRPRFLARVAIRLDQLETLWARACSCTACSRPLAETDVFSCPACQALRSEPATTDYHRLLGVEDGGYAVDSAGLDRRYRSLQNRLHPDRYATQGQDIQERASDYSALISQAYTTLKDPLRRAKYVLEQRGTSAGEEGETIEDPELLMEVMEARERLDDASSPEELQAMQQEYLAKQEACVQELQRAFQQSDMQLAAQLTTKLRYISRTAEAVKKKL